VAGIWFALSGCLTGVAPSPIPSGSADMAQAPNPNDHSQPTPDGGGPPILMPDLMGVPPMTAPGTISTDTTWMGAVNVTTDVTVAAGATLTVNPGTVVNVAQGFAITVSGVLRVLGTQAAPVVWNPQVSGQAWKGVTVAQGGSATISYANIDTTNTPFTCAQGALSCKVDHANMVHYTGVGAMLSAQATLDYVNVELGGSDGILETAPTGAVVTITNSTFHTTGGDAIVVTTGDLTFNHNKVYGDVKNGGPGLHCANHFNGTAGTMLVDHNDFYNTTYGLMASGMGSASKIVSNNFYDNSIAWGEASSTGVNPAVDLTNNYWGGAAPPPITGNSKTTPYSTTLIAGTGPQ
jgi:hypothetical protein